MRGRIVELEQGSAEWLAWRREGITATAAGQIVRLYPRDWNRTPAALEAQLLELASAWHDTAATERMERGRVGESRVREAFEAHKGREYPAACVEHHRLPQIRASLDGLNVEHDEIAEFKWPTNRGPFGLLAKVRAGQIPSYYYCQLQHQLLAAGCKRAHFVVGYQDACPDATGRCQRFGCIDGCASDVVRFEALIVLPRRDFLDGLLRAELAFWDRVVAIRAVA